MKPIKYGIKTYVIADSQSGYCYSLLVYDGKARTIQEIVLFLIGDLLYKNYRLYMDNFYNSVRTSEVLLALGVHTTGTFRSNRGEPKVLRYSTLKYCTIMHTEVKNIKNRSYGILSFYSFYLQPLAAFLVPSLVTFLYNCIMENNNVVHFSH
jgi:hypothetical protein